MPGIPIISIDQVRSEISSLRRTIQVHLENICELESRIHAVQQEIIAQNLRYEFLQHCPEVQRVRTLRLNGFRASLLNTRGNLYVCEQDLEERQSLLQELIKNNPSQEYYFKRRRLS